MHQKWHTNCPYIAATIYDNSYFMTNPHPAGYFIHHRSNGVTYCMKVTASQYHTFLFTLNVLKFFNSTAL